MNSHRFTIPEPRTHHLNHVALAQVIDTWNLDAPKPEFCIRCGNRGVIDGFGGTGAEPDDLPCPVCNDGRIDPVTVRFIDVE